MDANALTMLQQLASNPQMVGQLQSMLSLLSNSQQSPPPPPSSSARYQHDGHLTGMQLDALYGSSSSGSVPSPTATLTAAAAGRHSKHLPSQTHQQQQRSSSARARPSQTATSSSSSASATAAAAASAAAHKREKERADHLETQLRECKEQERLHARQGTQRIEMLEQELRNTATRVEQLTGVVQDQRRQLEAAEQRRELEAEELRHSYELAMQRKDVVHEEALKQVIKSRQLMNAAAQFENTVKQAGLSARTASLNVQRPQGQKSEKESRPSAMKRERADSEEVVEKEYAVDGATARRYEREGNAMDRKRSSFIMKEEYAGKDTDEEDEVQEKGNSRGVNVAPTTTRATAPPLPSRLSHRVKVGTPSLDKASGSRAPRRTSGTATGAKMSTVLTTARTVSSSSRIRRRAPRTPSMTNADRILSSSRSPVPPPLTSSAFTKRLPTGRPQDSPTPQGTSATTTTTQAKNLSVWNSSRREGPASKEIDLRSETVSPVPLPVAQQQQQQQQGNDYAMGKFVGQYGVNGGGSTSAYPPPPLPKSGPGGRAPLPTKIASRLPLTNANISSAGYTVGGSDAMATSGRNAGGGVTVPSVRSGTSSVVPGPTRSPSPVNPKRGPAITRRFLFTGLTDDEPEKLRVAIEELGQDGELLTSEFDEPPSHAATHIIVRGTPRSVKALCGVVAGKWLVAPEYIYASRQAGFWLDEFEEGGLRVFPPPLKCQRFLLTVEHPAIRAKLAQVIEYGGGEVVRSQASTAASPQWSSQGVVVITSGDDLLRYATQQIV